MFEFTLGEALQKGATTIVAGAGVQSNYCRQLAAACSKLGLGLHVVLRRTPGGGRLRFKVICFLISCLVLKLRLSKLMS